MVLARFRGFPWSSGPPGRFPLVPVPLVFPWSLAGRDRVKNTSETATASWVDSPMPANEAGPRPRVVVVSAAVRRRRSSSVGAGRPKSPPPSTDGPLDGHVPFCEVVPSVVRGIPQWFFGGLRYQGQKPHIFMNIIVFWPCRRRRPVQITSLFLKTCGCLAFVPHASKKHLAKQTLRAPSGCDAWDAAHQPPKVDLTMHLGFQYMVWGPVGNLRFWGSGRQPSQKVGGEALHLLEVFLGAAEAAQTPQIDDFRPAPKPCVSS